MAKFRVGIVGAAGFTGGEALRLVAAHPQLELAWATSRTFAGQPFSAVHDDWIGDGGTFQATATPTADAVLLCMGHGESKTWYAENHAFHHLRVVDLSQDFRLTATRSDFIYGLPELNRASIQQANHIANPGCFATAIQLALLPLAHAGLLQEVHVSGITGATGAGQKPSPTNHVAWRLNNFSTYKLFTHQHLLEVRESLTHVQPGFDAPIRFVPYRGPFNRGIIVTAYTPCSEPTAVLHKLYSSYYAEAPFTHVVEGEPHLKQVVGTNRCLVGVTQHDGMAIATAVLDNLLKGASGQAIQNLNLLLGLEETAGLSLKPIVF